VVGEFGGGCVVDADSKFSQKILDIAVAVAVVESKIELDCVAYDIWWEAVVFVSIHLRILPISAT
jgi:hypothetical protein